MPNSPWHKIAAIAVISGLLTVARCVRADGAHWTSNGPPAGIVAIAAAPSDPKIVYAGSTGADGGKGVFKSSDGGRNWIAVNYGITNKRINAVAVNPHNSKIVYAGYEGEGFYKTTDGGEHWATINRTPLHHGTSIAIDRFDSSIVYLGTDSGMFKSFDGGRTVAPLKNGQSEVGTVVNIVIDPRDNHTLYVSKFHDTEENSGIWKSKDAGATWTAANTGLSGGPLRQMGKDRHIDSARLTFALAIDPRDSKTLYTGTLALESSRLSMSANIGLAPPAASIPGCHSATTSTAWRSILAIRISSLPAPQAAGFIEQSMPDNIGLPTARVFRRKAIAVR